jgi:hypothetical protein
MKSILYGICIATLVAAAPVPTLATHAGNAAAPAQSGALATAADKNKAKGDGAKICRQLPSSSSRLPERVCLTAREWAEVDADSQ